jgi:myo-inositol 2-dehydrogenase / D-chiro-inositol 1-dehydrogenase
MTDRDTLSRRAFLQTGAVLSAGLALPHHAFANVAGAYAAGSDTIRVGLIGCGGRGTRGALQCLEAAPGVELTAMGDVAPDRLAASREQIAAYLAENAGLAPRVKVTGDTAFAGFDAYRHVIASDVDLVILAAPPGFRPLHLAAAVDAGKHVFAEKPIATDVAGVRSCLATYEQARQKGLGIGVGTQRRHHAGYIEVMHRVRDGAIGDVLNGQVYWNQGGLWNRARRPEWSDTEWQIRNWLYFAWLSGDHIVEQHVHNIDVANWVMGGPPVRAIGVGGRAARVEPEFGHVYDHFAIDFEYPNGVHIMSMSRQIQGARGRNGEWFQGSRGRSHTSENGPWAVTGANAWEWHRADDFVIHMVQEHADLITSIRAGRPINDLRRMAESNLTALMGREAAYTGGIIEYDALLAAEQDIAPGPLADIAYGALAVPPVPVPGRTQVERGFLEGWA